MVNKENPASVIVWGYVHELMTREEALQALRETDPIWRSYYTAEDYLVQIGL